MIVMGDEVGQWQVGRIEDAGLAAEKLEQTRRFLDNEARVGALAQRSVQKKDARRGIERPQTKRRLCVEIFGAQCGKMVCVGERAQAAVGLFCHDTQTCEGTLAGNQRRPRRNATLTRRMRNGTSTSGPMTAAKARSEEHTSELQSLMRNSYAVCC